ncbi:MAG: single-stranded DNA-binding protein [Desulfomicrobium escambiense]|nr:single-stranded DNA-binding protein [Desulfomicrobium escambiense]
MAGINKVIIVGQPGERPGGPLHARAGPPSPSSASPPPRSWKDKTSGEKKERTEWHRITAWGKLGEICGEYLSKGRQVYVEGRLQTSLLR